LISSESLLGGRYLSLEPGAEEDMIAPGGRIQYTQAPQNLEQLLGQFIFSMQGEKKDEKSSDASSSVPAADTPVEAPAVEEPPAQATAAEPAPADAPAAAEEPAAPADEVPADHP
jgi:phospholipid/cholesterol/gamma-HCH transport system substrate-binding protein